MIVTRDQAAHQARQGVESWALSDAGGLTQFGVHMQRLAPGARASERHWHSAEDELLFVLSGTATVLQDGGATALGPGGAALWRHGDPDAHCVGNAGAEPLEYLIVGSRAAHDVCTYPKSGQRQVNEDRNWRVEDAAGAVLRGGALPAELLNLAPAWGAAFDPAQPATRFVDSVGAVPVVEDGYVHPVLGGGLGAYSYVLLGDAGGLSQFGAHLEILPPGSRSSFRHWHEAEDEFLYVLEGNPVLVEDARTVLRPGDAVVWPAGDPVGHNLENPGPKTARYLVVGTRLPRDVIHYPDHDLITHKDGPSRRYLHADGTPYSKGETL